VNLFPLLTKKLYFKSPSEKQENNLGGGGGEGVSKKNGRAIVIIDM
jgi:hypothetical protein